MWLLQSQNQLSCSSSKALCVTQGACVSQLSGNEERRWNLSLMSLLNFVFACFSCLLYLECSIPKPSIKVFYHFFCHFSSSVSPLLTESIENILVWGFFFSCFFLQLFVSPIALFNSVCIEGIWAIPVFLTWLNSS